MTYVSLTDDLIHVGYRWLSTVGRSHHDHQVWCYGPSLPPYMKDDEECVEKLYIQKSYNVEISTVNVNK